MMLTKSYARIYQYSAVLLVFSITTLGYPVMIVVPLFVMLFISAYTLSSARSLSMVSPNWFYYDLVAFPNPAVAGEKAEVNLTLGIRKGEEFPLDVMVESEGMKLVRGTTFMKNIVRKNEYLTMKFGVTSAEAGVHSLGPVRLSVKDRNGLLAKEIELPIAAPIIFLKTSQRVPVPVTTHIDSKTPAPGYSRDPFIGLEEDYRISLPDTSEPASRITDWRRVARTGGEEIYVKEYDRRRSAEIIYGLGSGLDIAVSSRGLVKGYALNLLLHTIITHVKEGSRPWLLQRMENGGFSASRIFYGEGGLRITSAETLPTNGLLIYLTRLVDPREPRDLNMLEMNLKSNARLLLLNLTIEAGKHLPGIKAEQLRVLEEHRLRSKASTLQTWYSIIDLDSLATALDRITSTAWVSGVK